MLAFGVIKAPGECLDCHAMIPTDGPAYGAPGEGVPGGVICVSCRGKRPEPCAAEPLDQCPDCGREARGGEPALAAFRCEACAAINNGLTGFVQVKADPAVA